MTGDIATPIHVSLLWSGRIQAFPVVAMRVIFSGKNGVATAAGRCMASSRVTYNFSRLLNRATIFQQ